MPIFISRGNYTRDAITGMTANPEDRSAEVARLLKAAGGKLHGHYMTFGEYDFLVIGEAPKEEDVLATLIAVAGSGGVTNLNTTLAVDSSSMRKAFKKAQPLAKKFRAAGQ